jgi:hypothetical protein
MSRLQTKEGQKALETCGFCGVTLGDRYHFICHICGATYCYAHMPTRCAHRKPQAIAPTRN